MFLWNQYFLLLKVCSLRRIGCCSEKAQLFVQSHSLNHIRLEQFPEVPLPEDPFSIFAIC